jgi:peptidoglycan hydrolase-like amidase/predicted  nucleic acid-binding Zn-ribbon protein
MLLLVVPVIVQFQPVLARTSDEVQQDIDDKKKELESVKKELGNTESSLTNQQKSLDSVKGELPRIAAEIAQAEANLNYNKLQVADLKLNKELKELQQEQAEIRQEQLVKLSYLGWKTGVDNPADLLDNEKVKNNVYQTLIISDGYGSLQELVEYLNDLNQKIGYYETANATLQAKTIELEAKKKDLVKKQEEVNRRIEELSKQVTGIKQRKGSIESQLDTYYQEQKAIQDYERKLQEQNQGDNASGNNPQPPSEPGASRIYFSGTGRDLYQGHGVGMSQFGALGAALQGWDYKRILQFYYQGTEIKVHDPGKQISVQGYGTMHIDTYVAGAAEVPVTACEDLGIGFDYNNIWKCWPREAIKAQAVAYRTFALNATKTGNSICTTTSCQVYNGSQNMRWAADATAGEVVLYQGKPISAVYSSDNNQGGGTANNDTIWSNNAGDGTPYPYLRSVNDTAFAYRTSWGKYTWRTNNYTYNQIDQMLEYVNFDGNLSSYRSFINGIRTDVDKVTGIELIKDPSGRVSKVILIGTRGRRQLGGWLFKSLWNSWVANVKPSGQVDYIYSLTFSLRSS